MACILLDIDGVLHVSGEPIPGAADAVAELREPGHALRFVTNNSTRPRARLAEELREMGFDARGRRAADDAAARPRASSPASACSRSSMPRSCPTSTGSSSSARTPTPCSSAAATRRVEPNQVFSYMNLARAFAEIQLGAALYCLHKNRWWQTSRGPAARLGRVRRRARVRDGRRGDRARQAEPVVLRRRARRARRRAGADVDGRRTTSRPTSRRAAVRDEDGARAHGKFRPETLERADASAGHRRLARSRSFPRWLEEDLTGVAAP